MISIKLDLPFRITGGDAFTCFGIFLVPPCTTRPRQFLTESLSDGTWLEFWTRKPWIECQVESQISREKLWAYRIVYSIWSYWLFLRGLRALKSSVFLFARASAFLLLCQFLPNTRAQNAGSVFWFRSRCLLRLLLALLEALYADKSIIRYLFQFIAFSFSNTFRWFN